MKKILLIIIDGMGDEPIPKLGNKTPLEAAKKPNLNFLAKKGICGLISPFLYHTVIPTSEDTHFALFGYHSGIYGIRRGILEVKGIGMKMKKGDVALRGNFGTVDKNLNMVDRRAGRIDKTQPLIRRLNGMKINGVKFLIGKDKEYRVGIIMRGKNLSDKISDGDPYYAKLGKKVTRIIPFEKTQEAIRTAKILNKFLEKTHRILKYHPLNKKREKSGLPPANYLLVRGASSLKKIPLFKEKYGLKSCAIADFPLYKGIAEILGMDLIKVKGSTDSVNINLKGKILAAKKNLKKYDFVFLHIKTGDTLAHQGNFIEKMKFIEKIDKELKPILNLKNTLVVITCDHSTCSLLKTHCKKPIPVLFYKKEMKIDGISEFSEKACQKGKLGKIKQLNLMPTILAIT